MIPPAQQLAQENRLWLLAWARMHIQQTAQGVGRKSSRLNEENFEIAAYTAPQSINLSTVPEGCTAPQGCFVSIYQHNKLRGCIGTFSDEQALFEAVARMAKAAASHDPRFTAMGSEALDNRGMLINVRIEISALSARQPIAIEDIEIGRHGLWISQGASSGVLLPQVATAHGWNTQTFLQHTCEKAGLPPESWREEQTLIEAFEAEVFSDGEEMASPSEGVN